MPHAGVSGHKLYYELHGNHEGPPLLLIMGAGGSCRGWQSLQVPAFSEQHPVLIYDHRGVSESDDPGGPFTTADLADDAAGLLDALEIERAHVLGAFMGGMVAQELALRHPGRVARLILAGTFARPDAKRRVLLEHWRDLAHSGASVEVLMRERMLWTLDDATFEQTDLVDAMRSFLLRDGAPLSLDMFARQYDACLQHDCADRLHEIRQSTLIVCGRHDRLTPPTFHRELADEIPEARLVTIGYGGHLVMVESAEHWNRTVLQFLAES